MPRIAKEIGSFSKQEASTLFRKSKALLRSSHMDILCAPATKDFGRILVVTPKRIGKASKRNLVRRRLKALFFEERLFQKCYDCIVIVKKAGIDLNFSQLKTIIMQAFKHIGNDRETV